MAGSGKLSMKDLDTRLKAVEDRLGELAEGLKRIEELAYAGEIHPMVWRVHSANPVGRKNLTAAMESAERYWGRGTPGDRA